MTGILPKRSRVAVTRGEIDALERRLDKLATEHVELAAVVKETHAMTAAMFAALMKPQHGYDTSLIDRMADVVINVESGQRVAGWGVAVAKWLAAFGVIAGALYALTHFGQVPPQN